ncbi:MAG TPA: hypothetical protein VHJ99_09290 [Candidatus Dormibacteraeota bacterium]|nr:hypothetical protein [Candidatus Dormibacteraeota bacterium]
MIEGRDEADPGSRMAGRGGGAGEVRGGGVAAGARSFRAACRGVAAGFRAVWRDLVAEV